MGVPSDYDAWVTAFPELTGVNDAEYQIYFAFATLYYDNNGWPGTLPQAQMLLQLLTAHIAWLFAARDSNGNPATGGSQPAPALVGRIEGATEGSVSVQTDYDANQGSPSAQWYNQSRYGAAYWAATACFRTAFYVPRQKPLPGNWVTIPGMPLSGYFPFWGR